MRWPSAPQQNASGVNDNMARRAIPRCRAVLVAMVKTLRLEGALGTDAVRIKGVLHNGSIPGVMRTTSEALEDENNDESGESWAFKSFKQGWEPGKQTVLQKRLLVGGFGG